MKHNNKSQFIIKNGINGLGLFSSKDVKKGEVLFELIGPIISEPTRTSIQLQENLHVENELGSLVNHSCNANATVDRSLKAIVSIRHIEAGEEITFNYNENEDALASPFVCRCCGNVIQGINFNKTKEIS